jgi:hypothetical protein
MDAGVGLVVEQLSWVCPPLMVVLLKQTRQAYKCYSVVSILFLISRSKLVPDFALTLHFIHLLIVTLYSHSIPTNLLWWILQVVSAGMMTALGVWSCQYRELRPINFGGSSVQTSSGHAEENVHAEGQDLEQGYGRGRGRGRGRDGAGEYEMVGLKSNGEAS